MNQLALCVAVFAFIVCVCVAAVKLAGICRAWRRHGIRIPRQHVVLWLVGALVALRVAKILFLEMQRAGLF
ncbi:MAG: hypothetical protein J5600_05505 [Desulfovibrio sp.]|nr:hypothetical protein [Desulfovibrio sp.]